MAIGGYLLQNVKEERRYYNVNTKHVRLIGTEDEQKELEAEYLPDESNLFDTSKSLFEYLLPEPKLFFEQSELSATKVVSSVLVLTAKDQHNRTCHYHYVQE